MEKGLLRGDPFLLSLILMNKISVGKILLAIVFAAGICGFILIRFYPEQLPEMSLTTRVVLKITSGVIAIGAMYLLQRLNKKEKSDIS
jgi:hypothetical protein